jgi:hypothetical protein
MTSDAETMEHLPILLLPQRINTIRTLTFYWALRLDPLHLVEQEARETFPEFFGRPGVWKIIWHNISNIQSLQTLHVKLDVWPGAWQSINKEIITQLLQSIREVVRPKEFILSLPFSAMDGSPPQNTFLWSAIEEWEGSDPWDDLPCTIRRVSDRPNFDILCT